jgi:hypothetical protein
MTSRALAGQPGADTHLPFGQQQNLTRVVA